MVLSKFNLVRVPNHRIRLLDSAVDVTPPAARSGVIDGTAPQRAGFTSLRRGWTGLAFACQDDLVFSECEGGYGFELSGTLQTRRWDWLRGGRATSLRPRLCGCSVELGIACKDGGNRSWD